MKSENRKKFTDKRKIAVLGLGYVGTPLLALLADKFDCRGYDISAKRIRKLKTSWQTGGNVNRPANLKNVVLSCDPADIADCDFFIAVAPTPVGEDNRPDLSALGEMCATLGKIIKKNDIVVFESTVAPGTTEEFCKPILEKISGLTAEKDFFIGYSPERVNVADDSHSLKHVDKIISAGSPATLDIIREIYGGVLQGEIITASSIKVAEAAKIYENTQRDVLIALANQMASFCRSENIDIMEVTACAASKWNFAPIKPGLVGGHCIGVDPYYLIDRASKKKLELPLVECARKVNESKSDEVTDNILEIIGSSGKDIKDFSLLLLGISYKPDTPDIRNSKAAEVMNAVKKRVPGVICCDPVADSSRVKEEYGLTLTDIDTCRRTDFDLVVELVAHTCFRNIDFRTYSRISLIDLL